MVKWWNIRIFEIFVYQLVLFFAKYSIADFYFSIKIRLNIKRIFFFLVCGDLEKAQLITGQINIHVCGMC